MTKEEIIAGIQSCAEELGRVPTVADLKGMKKSVYGRSDGFSANGFPERRWALYPTAYG